MGFKNYMWPGNRKAKKYVFARIVNGGIIGEDYTVFFFFAFP